MKSSAPGRRCFVEGCRKSKMTHSVGTYLLGQALHRFGHDKIGRLFPRCHTLVPKLVCMHDPMVDLHVFFFLEKLEDHYKKNARSHAFQNFVRKTQTLNRHVICLVIVCNSSPSKSTLMSRHFPLSLRRRAGSRMVEATGIA